MKAYPRPGRRTDEGREGGRALSGMDGGGELLGGVYGELRHYAGIMGRWGGVEFGVV